MIFVTVGTHEQPFNRLIQKIDELKKQSELIKAQIESKNNNKNMN